MRRRRLATAVLAFVAAMGAAPVAGAIETTAFGIQPADADRLEVDLRPGHRTSAQFEVWNKGDRPLVLQLEVVPATVAADGDVELEGPPAPVSWSDVPARVELGPRERRTIELRIAAPRQLPDPVPDVAVLAQPATVAGESVPSVLQRLALVAHLERAGRDLPNLWPWAGVAIAAIAVVVAQIVVSRRRRSNGSRSR